jgi:hypothetical protein
VATEVSPANTLPGIQSQEPARAEVLSWRVALSLIVNVSVGMWLVIGKTVLLLAP